jgi:hypothetical protein
MRIFTAKVKLIAASVILFSSIALSQIPDFHWSTKGSGTLNDQGMAIAVDQMGYVYVTGQFFSTALSFAPGLTITMPGGSGNCDFFLAKFDPMGNAIWGMNGGGTLTDRGYGVTFDHQGQLLVTGHYFGTATFGSHTMTSSGNLDAFTFKADTAGNIIWMKEGKSVSQVSTRGIASDYYGNVVITGYYGSATVDSVRFDDIKLVTNGARDVFTVKYNNNGDVLWGRTGGGVLSGEEGKAVAVDIAGNVYVTGMYNDTASFGSVTLNGNGGSEIFIVKYDADGNLAWAKTAGGLKTDVGYGIALDGLGNLYVCGNVDSAATFESTNVLTAGGYDAFVAKYDTSGNLIWVSLAGGAANDVYLDIAVDRFGYCVTTGYFNGPATFGSFVLDGYAGDDASFVKYDQSGGVLWAKEGIGTDNDRGIAVTADGGGNLIASGYFKSWVKFGSDSLVSAGVEDVFIIKIGDNIIPVELASFTGNFEDGMVTLKWLTVTELNNYGFEIEKSFDKTNFDKIDFVKGIGTTTEKQFYTYIDNDVKTGKTYYRLRQIDFDGTFSYSNIIEVDINIPSKFELEQNYPNPFNPSTSIKYSLAAKSKVELKVYNILGKEVALLVNDTQDAGSYEVQFSVGSFGNAEKLSSGIYIYELNAGAFSAKKKMMLVK